MWRIRHVEAHDVELDFTSSGQRGARDMVLIADGHRLVNAARLLEYEASRDRVQVEICEKCGLTHCAPGGWISLRRLEDDVFWLPAFAAMSTDDESMEYRPPTYLSDARVAVLSERVYSSIRGHAPALPAPCDIEQLGSRDVVRLLQWEAPGRILGAFPDVPSLRHDMLIAVDQAGQNEHMTLLARLLDRAWGKPLRVSPFAGLERPMFYLDQPGHPVWTPLVGSGAMWGFSLGEGLDIVMSEDAA